MDVWGMCPKKMLNIYSGWDSHKNAFLRWFTLKLLLPLKLLICWKNVLKLSLPACKCKGVHISLSRGSLAPSCYFLGKVHSLFPPKKNCIGGGVILNSWGIKNFCLCWKLKRRGVLACNDIFSTPPQPQLNSCARPLVNAWTG